jgi:hypothetical protein
VAHSTVSGILTRIGMGKLGRLGLEAAQRYERERPGELIHIDVKKLGRIHDGAGHRVTGKRGHYTGQRTDTEGRVRNVVGWEFVHVAIDDATRLAYVEVLNNEKALTAIAFLRRAVEHFASYGMTVQQLITDKRLGLPFNDLRDRVSHARDPPPAHPPISPADQRQGRALHPHHARARRSRRTRPARSRLRQAGVDRRRRQWSGTAHRSVAGSRWPTARR